MEFRQKVIVSLLMLVLVMVAGCGTGNTVAADDAAGTVPAGDTTVDNGMVGMDADVTGEPTAAVSCSDDARVLVVTGVNFKFIVDGNDNPNILVKQGDKVCIRFESTEGFHDWVVDEFDAATEKVRPGTPTLVEFTADKKGTFEYYCSVGSHRANGMKGKLIVE